MSGATPTVLVVSDVYPPGSGGSGWSTHALVTALREHGHLVEVMEIAAAADAATHRTFEDVEVIGIPVASARRSRRQRLGAADYSMELVRDAVAARLRQRPAIDVVHAQHLHAAPGSVAAARQAAVAAVVTVRDHWPICLHGTEWWGGDVCSGCSVTNVAGCLSEYQGIPWPVGGVLTPWLRRRLGSRAAALAAAHRVTAVSRDLAGRIAERIPRLQIEVVPNMVDPRRGAAQVAAAAATPVPPLPARYLLAAGKLTPAKGFDRIVEELAAAGCRLPLLIAGAGPLQERLMRQAAATGQQVQLLGWVDGTSLLRLIAGAWAVVVPSLLNDSLPRVILEALSLGTPVVARRVGGSPETMTHGEAGWLYDDVAALREALTALESPERRESASRAAARTAEERFSPAVVLPQVLGVYEAARRAAGAR